MTTGEQLEFITNNGIKWFSDPGHAWLSVPLDMARQVKGISEYSYQDSHRAYLEEDCDAPRFFDAHMIQAMDNPIVANAIRVVFQEVSTVRGKKARFTYKR